MINIKSITTRLLRYCLFLGTNTMKSVIIFFALLAIAFSEEVDVLFDEDDPTGDNSDEGPVPELPPDYFTTPLTPPETSTEPADDISTPSGKPSTPGYSFDASCTCFIKSRTSKGVDASELLKNVLTEHPKPEHCDNKGMNDCVEFCREKVHEVTNDFDLTKPPKSSEEEIKVSLGQYLCNILGNHRFPFYLQSYAKIECKKTKPGWTSVTSHIANTGRYSQQPLVCVRGKFHILKKE